MNGALILEERAAVSLLALEIDNQLRAFRSVATDMKAAPAGAALQKRHGAVVLMAAPLG